MSLKDEFNSFIKAGLEGSDSITKDIPEAWRPRSEIGTEGGFVISTPRPDGNTPGAEEILREQAQRQEDGKAPGIASMFEGMDEKKFEDSFLNSNIGTVDYTSGIITLNSFAPLQVDNPLGQLAITVNPTTTIISSSYNRIITVDPFDPTAITVNLTAKS